MVSFILRRIFVSVLILLAASFIMYMLTAYSSDPLADLRQSQSLNKERLIQALTLSLQLDVPPPLRWFLWLGGAAKCLIPFANACDLGSTISNAQVTDILPRAMQSTIQLVTGALVLAILLGLALGIITALRQYSGLDNVITFTSFFLFSLPSFLVAVLLKEFFAIGFNNFLEKPIIAIPLIIAIAVILGLIVQSIIGGDGRRRLIVGGATTVISAIVLYSISLSGWLLHPGLGPVAILLLSVGVAVGLTALIAGLRNRRALISGLIVVVLALIAYFALQGLFNISSAATLVILAIVTVVVGLVVGFLMGGYDRSQSMRVASITALLSGGLVLLDRFMQSWPTYFSEVNGRPIATVGYQTPNLGGDVWVSGIDSFTHFLLPTVALLLISFASYTRYARAGMLETMGQDYVRTARAKGLPERTVVIRHAFRNMLIPITTLVAFDVGALLGGAIITEAIFGIPGMGQLFFAGLGRGDLNPVMGYFIVIAGMAILFNFLADLAYAALDPRVRVH